MRSLLLCSSAATLFAACATPRSDSPAPASAEPAGAWGAVLNAPDRTDADRKLDPGRHPAAYLDFLGVQPGMRVADLGAGMGYTTELLARAVGDSGVVFAQNAPAMLARIGAGPLEERLARPVNRHVVRVDRDFADPLPPAADLDLAVMNAIYHDTVWLQVDRDQMNRAIFASLKPGGHYVVIDSSSKPGRGTQDAQSLHRIDEETVKQEVVRAGFTLEGTSDFLRNPQDARDWNSSPRAAGERRGTSDRFALRFVKPR